MNNKSNRSTIALSGGFDPPTAGQVAMILDASNFADVTIILNSDEWCGRKRWSGKNFIKWQKRANILREIPGVVDVVRVDDSDGTVCEALRRLIPDFFGNGGNRTVENTPEVQLCKQLGIGTVWFLGGSPSQEATDALKTAIQISSKEEER